MSAPDWVELAKRHTLFSWSATDAVEPLPIVRAEGVYVYGAGGERWLDFNSQLMCVNVGHSHPKVIAAIKRQLDTLPYVYPGAVTEVRGRVAAYLAGLLPGDLDCLFFTLGGTEANEHAIRAARHLTGRHKILARYRSYHGGTQATLELSGDPRRWGAEPGSGGVVRVMDPWPYGFSYGETDAEVVARNLAYVEDVIRAEGPQTIAAMIVETVTGTNGILPPPEGYLPALQELLGRYGILLICDEVMCGWGRTGRRFAFEHQGIVPDLVTMAKGLTSAYLPLGAVAFRRVHADVFRSKPFPGGLTYNSHAVCLAAAEAAVQVLEEEGLVGNAARMGEVMRGHMERLAAAHPSVATHRNLGLFGIVEVQRDREGTPRVPYAGRDPVMDALGARLRERGLFTFLRWGGIMCNPPLCVTEEQLAEGFAIVDEALTITDAALA